MPGPDLHLHSTASDGTYTPRDLVALACDAGLPAIALTDHDSVAGIAGALEAASGRPLVVIPGVELSAEIGDRSVHILGYYIDHTDAVLLDRLERLRRVRAERAERIVTALNADGIDITIREVLVVADGGAVGRAHIAQLLVDRGHASSVPDAFARLLGSGAPYYVPKPLSSASEAIGWIREAHGVAVLAHPGLSRVDDLLPHLVAAGIVGIEAFHSSHTAAERAHYAHLADSLGLIATGGSDFHGESRLEAGLGSVDVPHDTPDRLATARTSGGRQ